MARGLEVLAAALEGKRVRYFAEDEWSCWYHWDAPYLAMPEGGKLFDARIAELFRYNWQIEEPTMAFMEAIEAMDAGQVVERTLPTGWGHLPTRYRWRRWSEGDGYEYACELTMGEPFRDWIVTGFDPDAIHATDWRIVPDENESLDKRPSQAAVIKHLLYCDPLNLTSVDAIRIVEELAVAYPAMFREETP